MTAEGGRIRLRAAAESLVGRVRAANQDNYLVTADLVAVADGMGGHAAGEVASELAVETLAEDTGPRSIESLMTAVADANSRIFERATIDEDKRGMGTTLCLAAVVADRDDDRSERVAIVNVGDSRVYLLADSELHQLTEDHSLVETLVREGRITPAEAAVHPQRNVLTRALGVDIAVLADAWLLEVCSGDRLLLCSDGLFNELDLDQIRQILIDSDTPDTAASRLAAEADAAGGRDNITAVVADMDGARTAMAPLGARLRWLGSSSGHEDGDHHRSLGDTANVPVVTPPETMADGPPEAAVKDDADQPDSDDADGERTDDDADGERTDGGRTSDDADGERTDDDADGGRTDDDADGERTDGGRTDDDADDSMTDAEQVDDDTASLGPSDISSDVEVGSGVNLDPDADTDVDNGTGDGAGAGHGSPSRGGNPPWRTIMFIVAIVAVLVAGLTAVTLWARAGWTVKARGQQIVVRSGRVEGFPAFGATTSSIVEDVHTDDLADSSRRRVERGEHFNSRAEADGFVQKLQLKAAPTSSTTVPTSTTTPTTAAPTTAAPTTTDQPNDTVTGVAPAAGDPTPSPNDVGSVPTAPAAPKGP